MRGVNGNNLRFLECVNQRPVELGYNLPVVNRVIAVPKSLFLNICGLNKTKNKIRASVALAADLRTMDVDVSIIFETHLCKQIRLLEWMAITFIEGAATWVIGTNARMVALRFLSEIT